MGWKEEKKRAKEFEQQTDEALATDILNDNLFSNMPVERHYTFECIREPQDAPVKVGDHVRLIDMKDQIEVYVRTQPVGHILPGLTELVREQLRLNQRKGRSVPGKVVDVSELTPSFNVCVCKPE
jgi:hypothetical protein